MERIVIPPYDSYGVATLVVHGDLVVTGHFGGQAAADGTPQVGISAQAREAFAHLARALQAAGLRLGDVMKVTVILRDIVDFDAMHAVWADVFPHNPPARTTITSDFVDAACLIQVEAIAARREEPARPRLV